MIVNKGNGQIADMLAFLAKIGVSRQDCALAEQYLNGEVGDEVLDQFQRIDFAAKAFPYSITYELDSIMKGVGRADKRAACIRLFNVMFAIGHSSCAAFFYAFHQHPIEAVMECALYKKLILFMERWGKYMSSYDLGRMREIAQNNPENLRESMHLIRKEGSQYLLMALTVYFWMKYTEAKQLAAEDVELMKEYEDAILECLDEWLQQQACFGHDRIVSAVRAHQLTKEMIDGIIQCALSEDARRQICSIGCMAYLNFQLSDVLMDVVRVCLAVDAEWVLFAFSDASKEKISSGGGDYDELFWIEPDTYIRWAAVQNYPRILKRQLEKNQEHYLKAIDGEGYKTCFVKSHSKKSAGEDWISAINALKDVLKEENFQLYEQINAAKPYYDKVIHYLVRDTPNAELAREYLRGHCKISALYPHEEEFVTGYVSYDYMHGYQRHCNDPGFFDRCKAFMVLACSEFIRVVENCEKEVEQVEQFYHLLDAQDMDIVHQLNGFMAIYGSRDCWRGCDAELFVKGTVNTFARYLNGERREETLAAFSGAKAEGRYLALLVMRKDTARNKQEILNYASDSTRLVREELLDILYGQQDWLDEIKVLLEAKKMAQRELAARVLTHWQQESGGYNEVLLHAIKKEKNAKILTMLQGALDIQEGGLSKETLSREELVKQLNKGSKKKSLEWAYQKPFPVVHRTNGDVVQEEYLQAVLLCYASQETNGVSKNAQMLVEDFEAAEFARYVNELFDRWFAAGAEAKKRWVLYVSSIHGGEDMVQKLRHQIQEWPQAARGAIAAEAVKALALSPLPHALLIVDGIARKFKFKQVKAAAGEALEFAAAELGITREELSDRIVPDLGFDENMERMFDYGERSFKVMLTPALEIEVYDENGKKLKNLPVPGKKDDEGKAAAAYEDFKQMKKQMKTTVSSQRMRLEYALSVKREWSVEAWEALFVKNPLMHQFAIGLVWGVYEDGKLVQSFRYMEDGSFNTQDEEEYELPKEARISLVHPMELSDEEKAAWKEQLADYEITQPVDQIDREVYYMTEEEADKKGLERFGGCIINDLSLNGKLTGLGWYRGSVQDAGCFDTYYREDTEAGIGVELHFSGAYVGGLGEDVTIYDVRFYKAGTVARGSYVYDEADGENAYFLKDIPLRYFSEIVLQLTKATASSEERDEGWKAEAGLK